MDFNAVLFIIMVVLVGISPVVHRRAGKKYSFPLAGLAVALLAIQFI